MLRCHRFEYEQSSRSQSRNDLRSEIALKIVEIHYAVETVRRDVEAFEVDRCCCDCQFALARKLHAFLKSQFGNIQRDHLKPALGQKERVAPRARRKVERKPAAWKRIAVFAQKFGRLARSGGVARVSRFPFRSVRHRYRLQHEPLLLIASSRVL